MKPRSLGIAMRLVRLLATTIFGLGWFATSVPTTHADTLTYQPGPSQGKDAWITNYYDYGSNYGVDNELLRVGGWGDAYWSALWFDLNGLPANVSSVKLQLYCLPKGTGDTSTPVSMNMYQLGGDWTEDSLSWYDDTVYYSGTKVSLPTPTQGAWYTIDITTYYRNWKSGIWLNDGLWLTPTANNNRFNQFASSDYPTATYRPKLVVTYTPILDLNFPLSGSFSPSKITGYDFGDHWENQFCVDGQDPLLHTGVDLTASANSTVYAAKGGVIKYSATDSKWGGYICTQHTENNITYTITYTHVIPGSGITTGKTVSEGQRIGKIANLSTGPHLHLQIRLAPYHATWSLRGRLPSTQCYVRVGTTNVLEPGFPEYFVDPKQLRWH